MTIEQWIAIATRKLAPESIEQVRREIGEHYQSALDAGTWDITSLGDPRKANRDYRKVLLTAAESKFVKCQKIVPPGSWRWWGMAVLGLLTVLAWASRFPLNGRPGLVWRAWPLGVLLLIQYLGPLLPIKTPARLRLWHGIRGIGFAVAMVLLVTVWDGTIFGVMTQFFAAISFQGASAAIRRKVPVDSWPNGWFC